VETLAEVFEMALVADQTSEPEPRELAGAV
jgi:hypothetical protein